MEETRVRRGISEAVLKNVAVVTMTIDHVAAFLVKAWLRGQGVTNLYSSNLYTYGRIIGRIAFVLYAFMIAEGAVRTHCKWKYALRLLVLAVISIIPHSYVNAQKLFNPNDLNIFFLLFLGLVTIYAWDWLKQTIKNTAASMILRVLDVAAACVIAVVFHIEYGMFGILLIMMFYLCRDNFPKMAVFGVLTMSVGYMANVIITHNAPQWIAQHSSNLLSSILSTDRIQIYGLLAFPFIWFYNGEKGKQLPKAFYYLFYPVHLGIIALILYL